MGAGVRDAFPPPMCVVFIVYAFRLGGLRVERLVSLGKIARKWLFGLCGIAWKNITEIGRGGACVPARVAPQGRIHRLFPRGMMTPKCVWWMTCSKS